MPSQESRTPRRALKSTAARWLLGLALAGAGAGCEAPLPSAEPTAPAEELATETSPLLTAVTSFGTNPGNLKMYKYVPANLPANGPMVVALHGCTQTAAAYEAAGWNALADLWKFSVLYPEQQSSNNPSSCFNWFEPGDIARGGGEALSIKQMVDKMKTDHAVDASRVFVTGLSAGAAMTSVMAATYPDVFAGAAIMAGLPYKCATSMNDAFNCMNPGSDKTPATWGGLVRGAFGHTGAYPKISIWHGTSDSTVKSTNMTELVEQWTNVHGIDQTEDLSETVAGYPHKVYKNAAGQALVETYALTGKGHGTAVDPQFKFPGSTVGCGTAGAFILDVDLCSTYHVGRFFGLDNTDSQAPTVSLTAPAGGSTVSGTVPVRATASDNVGVARVEFLIDGNLVGSDTASPYEYAWNAATATNGTHTLSAKAYDAAGNAGTAAPLTVTVTGGQVDTTPPTVAFTFPANNAVLSGSVTLTATASDDAEVARVEFFLDGTSLGVGVASLQAGPYAYTWNTTSATQGSHTLHAKAWDAAGNTATTPNVLVSVNQTAVSFAENFSSGGPDNKDAWSLTEWPLSTDDRGGITGSQSINGSATASFGTATKTASVSVTLGSNPRLTYWRKVSLSGANTSASAAFRVVVNAGSDVVVDSLTKTGAGTSGESTWTQRADVDLTAYANRTVVLKFIVTATDTGSNLSYARAWVDGLAIGPPSANADTTPPTVNLTAPATGATVSGTVDVAATASDSGGVSKVEFYLDGVLVDTDTTSPYGFTWNTTATANGGHALMAKAYDAANNIGTDNDTSVTVSNTGGGKTTVSFTSLAADDGYVKANADGSAPAVGTLSTPALGRGSDSKFNRAIYSFDTSTIPDTAKVLRAWLKVTWSSGSGDPWTDPVGNTLQMDVKNGTFGTAAMETTDFTAAATANNVANIIKFTSGTQSSTDFTATGLGALNKTGKTQLKLRFALDPTGTRYLFLTEGEGAVLTVEYE